jgi:hypothetical protein
MKMLWALLAAVTLATALMTSSPAEARCWWNGYRRVCVHPHPYGGITGHTAGITGTGGIGAGAITTRIAAVDHPETMLGKGWAPTSLPHCSRLRDVQVKLTIPVGQPIG